MKFYYFYENPYDIDMFYIFEKFINISHLDDFDGDGFLIMNHNDEDKLYLFENKYEHLKDKLSILSIYAWESYTDMVHLYHFYDKLKKIRFNSDKVITLYNNIYKWGINEYNVHKFGKIKMLSFPRLLFEKHFINENEFRDIHYLRNNLSKFDYSCFNRMGRLHKQKVLDEIYDLGMNCFNTYKFSNVYNVNENIKLYNIKVNNNDIPIHTEFYKGRVNICVETIYDTVDISVMYFDKMIHLTEKIFKNVMLKIPFVLVGHMGSLKRFREMGFKTFDKIIDESYDESNDIVRYKLAIKSAQYLLNHYDSNEVQDILDYNFNLLIDSNHINTKFKEYFTNPLKKHIENLDN